MAKLKSDSRARFKSAGTRGKAPGATDENLQKKAEHLSRSIMDSAQQIWLAGMGAFSRAQAEGTKMFESLVSEGLTLEQRTRKAAGGHVDAVRDAVESKVGQVRERATDTWDRLEKVFEDRVQHALTRLGVPGRDDLQSLIARVDELNAQLRNLSATPAAPAAKRRSAVKSAGVRTPTTPRKSVKAKPATATRPAVKKAPVKHAAAPAAESSDGGSA